MENKPKCITDTNGNKYWYLNDKLHREDGPAVEIADGSKRWCLNGETHREDGPAIMWADGTKKWYINGNQHRLDGPAIISSHGYNEWYNEWYINDHFVTKEITQWAKENDIDLDNLTDVDKALIKLTWADYGK
jgi:hypothetical protein